MDLKGDQLIVKTDPLFESTYNPDIKAALSHQFGPFDEHHMRVHATTPGLLRMLEKMASSQNPRRGEVVMVIPNDAGHIWLHAKQQYPTGVYRLMTGGLHLEESPVAALRREVAEETGFLVTIQRCLGVMTYEISGNGYPTQPFVSFIFLTSPASGEPQPTDPAEAIIGFKAVVPAQLDQVTRQLRSITGEYKDWGIFRAAAHKIAATALLK